MARSNSEALDLPPGKRLTIVGSTGSGKTTLARRILDASNYHWVIFNPKATATYSRLHPHKTIERIKENELRRAIERNKYVILNLSPSWNHAAQDQLLQYLCDHFTDIGFCIDEAYTMHNRANAGPGITGLVTRGRELNQSAIFLSQRPKWISQFLFSEADYIAEFKLLLKKDRHVVFENTGQAAAMSKRNGHDFIYFNLAEDRFTVYRG